MPTPGYIFVGYTVSDPTKVDSAASARYSELAAKAMASVGTSIEIIGTGAGPAIEIYAGSYEGQTLALERFGTHDDLHAFWNSPEYEEAKPIRHGFEGTEFHFLVALRGVDATAENATAFSIIAGASSGNAGGVTLVEQADAELFEGEAPFDEPVTIRAHSTVDDARACVAAAVGATFSAVIPTAPGTEVAADE